jgi:hypothetical protein
VQAGLVDQRVGRRRPSASHRERPSARRGEGLVPTREIAHHPGAPLMYPCAMASEGTPGKWSLWATHPERLGGIAELYATEASVSARAGDLRQAGYKVEVFLSRPTRLPAGSSGLARA